MFARLPHYLFPSESNNYRARLLHNKSLNLISLGFLCFQLVLSSFLLVRPKVLGYAAQISPERVVELTNQERTKTGLSPVTLNSQLNEAALRKAGDMFAFDYWAHVSPSGREPWDFFREVGYHYVYAGENLARDFSSADAAVSAWMASPSHKDNIINPKYQEIGVAVVDGTLGSVETTLIVQLFGARSTAPVALKPKAPAPATEQPEIAQVSKSEEVASAGEPEIPTQKIIVLGPQTQILSRATGKERSLINPFSLTQGTGILAFGLLAGLFVVDAFYVWKGKVVRLTGRPMAHMLFLLMMMLIILLSQRGQII